LTRIANCGDQIPSFVRLYISLGNNTEATSVIQELFGRACGYGKKFKDLPYIFVSEQNKDMLECFIKSGSIFANTDVKNTIRISRGEIRKTLNKNSYDDLRYIEAFGKLEKHIHPKVKGAWIKNKIDGANPQRWYNDYEQSHSENKTGKPDHEDSWISASAFDEFLNVVKDMPGCENIIVEKVFDKSNGYNRYEMVPSTTSTGNKKVPDYDKHYKGVWHYHSNTAIMKIRVRYRSQREGDNYSPQPDHVSNPGQNWCPTLGLSVTDRSNILFSVTVLQKGPYKAAPVIDLLTGRQKSNSNGDLEYTYEDRSLPSAIAGDINGSSCVAVDGSYIKRRS
jgi:hypothetical protein